MTARRSWQQLNQALAGRQWFHPQDSPWRQALAKKAAENAEMIRPQIEDDSAPGNYYRPFRDIREWLPKNVVLGSEGANTMDIGGTQMPIVATPHSYLNAGSYGTMGVGLGLVVASCVVHPDRPVVHVSGDSAIGFSGMEMETLCRYGMPAKIVVLNNGGIGPGMPEIPDNPMLNMRPNTLIYGARYDKMMQAFGGFGAYVEDPKDTRDALNEPMNSPAPASSTSSSARARSARRSSSAGTPDLAKVQGPRNFRRGRPAHARLSRLGIRRRSKASSFAPPTCLRARPSLVPLADHEIEHAADEQHGYADRDDRADDAAVDGLELFVVQCTHSDLIGFLMLQHFALLW